MGFSIHGISSDINKGIKLLESAGDNYSTIAFMKLGELYQSGVLVNKDLTKALEWYTKGSNISNYLQSRDMNDFKKKVQEVTMLQNAKLADEGDIRAIWELGNQYYNSNYIHENLIKAKELFTRGAKIFEDNPNNPYYKLYYKNFLDRIKNIEMRQSEYNI